MTDPDKQPVVLPIRGKSGVALEDRLAEPYNEDSFGYFLFIERKRSERSGHAFFLLLVDLAEQAGVSAWIDRPLASQLFVGLQACLRKTDFVGWYREGRVVGAVLTESRNRPRTDVSHAVGQRVSDTLRARVHQDVASRLRIRIHRSPDSERIESTSVSARWASANSKATSSQGDIR